MASKYSNIAKKYTNGVKDTLDTVTEPTTKTASKYSNIAKKYTGAVSDATNGYTRAVGDAADGFTRAVDTTIDRVVDTKPGPFQRFLGTAIEALTPESQREREVAQLAAARETIARGELVSPLEALETPTFETELARRQQQEQEALATAAGRAGQVAGEIGKFGLGYAAGGGIVERAVAPATGALARAIGGRVGQAVGTLATEFAKDVIIGQPLNYVEGKEQGLEGAELAKYMGKQAIIDVVANGVFYGLGKGFQALKKANPQQVQEATEQIAKETTLPIEEVDKVIKAELPKIEEPEIRAPELEAPIIETQVKTEVPEYTNIINKATDYKAKSALSYNTTDLTRNLEDTFGKDVGPIKKTFLEPLDQAKKSNVVEEKQLLDELNQNIVQKLGIKKGSKLSALVQQFGEKRKTYEQIVQEVGRADADKVVEADRFFRQQYDRLIDEINVTRQQIYPNVEAQIQQVQNRIRDLTDKIQTKQIELDGLKRKDTKKAKKLAEQISNYKESVNAKTELLQSGELLKNKRIPKREDYYRHFRDLSSTFEGIKNLFETPAAIDPSLKGISAFTKPKSKWSSIMQRRGLGKFTDDAVGGFLDYIPAATYAKNIDPQIQRFRDFADDLSDNTTGELNNFIGYLRNFANDLAGKTTNIDRVVRDEVLGEKTYKLVNALNSRMKANAVLGNMSSAVSQILNIPNGMALVKDPQSLAKGIYSAIGSTVDKGHSQLYKQSGFLEERYLDKAFREFDTKLLDQPKNFAAWILNLGDEVGTKYIWSSAYEKGLKEGVENPIKYADDLTRKAVGGRGIGEVPLLQKSKVYQLIAPFTLEVNNALKVQKDLLKKKDLFGLATLYVMNYIFNNATENLTGNRALFDPIDAIGEVSQNPDLTPQKAVGRMAGELLSATPGGQFIASVYPEYGAEIPGGVTLPTREEFFGEADPTRFGTGLPIARAIQQPGKYLALPFGGAQISKMQRAIPTLMTGESLTRAGDRLRTPVEVTPTTIARGLAFGESGIPEVQEFYREDVMPLGTKQTENFNILTTQYNIDPKKLYDFISANRGKTKKRDIQSALLESEFTPDEMGAVYRLFYGFK